MKRNKKPIQRENRIICLPFDQKTYLETVNDAEKFRTKIEEFLNLFPELFPHRILNGYLLLETRLSKKLSIPIRRIKIGRTSYTIRPSFVMPYMTGLTDLVERALLMRKYSVPFHALSRSFGGSSQKWFRMEQNMGQNSLVGTTVRSKKDLPQHAVGDEKHTKRQGQKVYLATTVAKNCFFGVSPAENASEPELTKAYGVFKQESTAIEPDYAPETVMTDGFLATQNAWKTLFPSIILILCFLHVFLKLRKNKSKFKKVFEQLSQKLWHCYEASDKRTFSQRLRRLLEWCDSYEEEQLPSIVTEKLEKLRLNAANATVAYDYPPAPRTTNMVDRLMKRMDRHLFNTQYFHGSPETAELSIRGWALIENFAPSNPHTLKKHDGWQSPAERLNQSCYHESWLQNLLISARKWRYF